ncbi:MAG: DUF1517 domain-containing protein [Kofleriaceae bacterium]|nr:DUF1517 domain-containing protein [Kofleriaceae bacterium]MBP9169864.1 DUF1517 domain-containing protein [Kofleriaceae bacterium]
MTACATGLAARRGLHAARAALSLLVLFAFGGRAHAQESGGSIGGGDWDRPSRSAGATGSPDTSSTDPSSTSWAVDSRSRHRSSHDDTDRSSTGSRPAGGAESWAVLGLVVLVGGLFALAAMALRDRGPGIPEEDHEPTADRADVTMVCVVLDATVRPAVQAALDRLGRTADPTQADGRSRLLHEVTVLLRRHRAAWVYGGAIDHPMTDLDEARRIFRQRTGTARSTYTTEVLRNADGQVHIDDAPVVARSSEGPGLLLVTLLVASRRQLVTVGVPEDGEALRRAIEALGSLNPAALIALEIVWTPAAPTDRMTSAEAERVLTALACRFAKLPGALAGTAICDFCDGLYPAEAYSCVHCGAAPRSTVTA